MKGRAIGSIFAELDLDTSKMTRKQKEIINDANNTALGVEKSWRIIGKQSDAMYDQMRKRINNAYDQIKNKAGVTSAEIVRAEKAAKAKLKQIDDQQYGRQTSMLSKMKKNWLAYTAAITAAYMVMSRTIRNVRERIEYADKIAKTADVIGVTTDALQEYRYAADLSGVSTEYLDKGLQKFVRNLGDAKNGTGTLTTFLRKFDQELFNNITTTKSVDEGLNMMFDALSKTNDMTERNALAAAAFGRSGQQMIVMIKNGYEALEKMRKEARDMGIVLEEDLLRNAEIANDRFTTLSYILKARVTEAIITLAPQIVKLTENIINATVAVSRAIEGFDMFFGVSKKGQLYKDLQLATDQLEIYERIQAGTASFMDKMEAKGFGRKPAEQIEKLNAIIADIRSQLNEIENVTRGKGGKSGGTGTIDNQPEFDRLLKQQNDYEYQVRQLSRNTYEQKRHDIYRWAEDQKTALEKNGKYNSEIESQLTATSMAKLKLLREQYQKDFMDKYEDMNKSKFDMERDAVKRQSELWKEAGADRIKVEEYTQKKLSEINKAEQKQRMQDIQTTTGMMADNFKSIAEMGGKHSKEAFALYKAFKITETIISTYSGAMKAYEAMASIPYVGPVLGATAAATVVAFGMAQVSAIKSSQPPSYDSGGISNARGIYQTGDIREAHVPIPSGKIPVELKGERQPVVEIHNHLENSTFYDQEKQAQVFNQLAERAVWNNFAEVYEHNYKNAGMIRDYTRRRP